MIFLLRGALPNWVTERLCQGDPLNPHHYARTETRAQRYQYGGWGIGLCMLHSMVDRDGRGHGIEHRVSRHNSIAAGIAYLGTDERCDTFVSNGQGDGSGASEIADAGIADGSGEG